jgi:hypothetical protein
MEGIPSAGDLAVKIMNRHGRLIQPKASSFGFSLYMCIQSTFIATPLKLNKRKGIILDITQTFLILVLFQKNTKSKWVKTQYIMESIG